MTIFLSPDTQLFAADDPSFNPDQPVIGYNNIVPRADVTAMLEAVNFPASNLQTPSTAEMWRGSQVIRQWIRVLGSSDDVVDYLAIARHNFSTHNYALTLEGYHNVDATSNILWFTIVPSFIPGDDQPLLLRFPPDRYAGFRLWMTPKPRSPGQEPPRLANLFLGRSLLLQRRIHTGHTPAPFGRVSKTTSSISETGQFLGRTERSLTRATKVAIQNIDPGWYRDHLDPFLDAARIDPFFFSWRPGAYPREVVFAWLKGNPTVVNQRTNGMMQAEFGIGAIAV